MTEKLFEEIIVENFPNLLKEADMQVQEARNISNKMNPKRPTPRHIMIKMSKVKKRILKAAREKQLVIYRGTLIRLSADFLAESSQVRRE